MEAIDLLSKRGYLLENDDLTKLIIDILKQQVSSDIEHQRKLLTVLFLDVVNSTENFGSLDPEVNMTIMDSALKELSQPIIAHRGRVTRFMGDGFLAIFGLPIARETDPEMAVTAALDILSVSGSIAEKLQSTYDIKNFMIRIGINTGLVVTGGLTESSDTLMGAAVNLASRIESQALPNSVFISESTFKFVKDKFDINYYGKIDAKGFEDLINVYQVIKIKPVYDQTLIRGAGSLSVDFIGRTEELDQLMGFYQLVVSKRQPNLIRIEGELGVGKSRLIDQFISIVTSENPEILVLKAQASESKIKFPYYIFRQFFLRKLRITENTSHSVVKTSFADGIGLRLDEDSSEITNQATLLAHFLGFYFPDNPYIEMFSDNPKMIRELAILYLMKYLRSYSEESAVLLVIEDSNFMDLESVEILQTLVDLLQDQPIGIIYSCRSTTESKPSTVTVRESEIHIVLQQLEEIESKELIIQSLLGFDDEGFIEYILTNTAGNPYYISEFISMIMDQNILIREDDHFRLTTTEYHHLKIPSTLTGVLQARLDTLSPKEKLLLQLAAIFGLEFEQNLLLELYRDALQSEISPEQVDLLLSFLEDKHFISSYHQTNTSGHYFFGNSLFRDVVYESILIRDRENYHCHIAELLHDDPENAGVVALHYDYANRAEDALTYYLIAVNKAVTTNALNSANDMFDRIVELQIGLNTDLVDLYLTLSRQEAILRQIGNRDQQYRVLSKLEETASQLKNDKYNIEVLLGWGWYYYWMGDFDEMMARSDKAVALLGEINDNPLSQEVSYFRAWAFYLTDEIVEAGKFATISLDIARRLQNTRGIGNSANILGLIAMNRGDFFRAVQHMDVFLESAKLLNEPDRIGTAYNNRGIPMIRLGLLNQAEENYHELFAFTEEYNNDTISISSAQVNLCWALATGGKIDEAIDIGLQGMKNKKLIQHAEGQAECSMWLAASYFEKKKYQIAMEYYKTAYAIRLELQQIPLSLGSLAGCIRCADALYQTKEVRSMTKELIKTIVGGISLDSTWEPLRILLTAYQFGQRFKYKDTNLILDKAFQLFHYYLDQIPEDTYKESFIKNIPWHQELQTIFKEKNLERE